MEEDSKLTKKYFHMTGVNTDNIFGINDPSLSVYDGNYHIIFRFDL